MAAAMLNDLRYALRTIAKHRISSIVILAVLAVGIGANTAIFGAVDAILLRPLPFSNPDRLAVVWETSPRSNVRIGPSGPNYLDFKRETATFDDMAALEGGSGTVTGFGEPKQVPGLRVTTNYLRVLGIAPWRGRDFASGEAWSDRVVIVSYGFWERTMGRAPDVIGRRLMLDDLPYTIIGVTPRTFWSPVPSELLAPWSDADLRARSRTAHDFGVIGRLKATATPAQAAAELSTLERRIARESPQLQGWGVTVVPLQALVGESLGAPMTVLIGAVGLVLLVACANIATLLLARAAEREHETAIRRALGATGHRLVRQFLSESLLLALIGGAAGLLVALWGVEILDRVLPATLPVTQGGAVSRPPIILDTATFAFATLTSAIAAMLFGLGPTVATAFPNVNDALKEGGRAVSASHTRVRSALIILEVSLAVLVITCAGLTVRSFWDLAHVDPGFGPDRLLALEMELPTDARYTSASDQRVFFSATLEKASAVPGVQRAALTTILPLDPTLARRQAFAIVNEPPPAPGDLPRTAARRSVSAGYFETMAIPLRDGRTLTAADRDGRPDVAVIDETFARSYFGGRIRAVGQHLRIGTREIEIVGIVGAVRQDGLDKDALPTLYLSMLQFPDPLMSLVVRTSGDPGAVVTAVKDAVYAVDRDQPVYRIRTMAQALADITSSQRLTMTLLTAFALAALVLASIGIYGLLAGAVTQRTHEIGIRMALGAAPRQIVRLVVGEGIAVTLVGVTVGLALALAGTRVLASILYRVDVRDPLTFAATIALVTLAAALASYLPARRATAVDPIVSLRRE
jgi:putative ABC transport system permease protein